jgi:hypothetical protein
MTETSKTYEEFCHELAELSKKYGIVIKSVGGVSIYSQEVLKDFSGYTSDLESGDIEPIWEE